MGEVVDISTRRKSTVSFFDSDCDKSFSILEKVREMKWRLETILYNQRGRNRDQIIKGITTGVDLFMSRMSDSALCGYLLESNEVDWQYDPVFYYRVLHQVLTRELYKTRIWL